MHSDGELADDRVNLPLEGEELQMTRGVSHLNTQFNELAQQVFVAATEIGAVSTLLQEKGLISEQELATQRTTVAARLKAMFQEKQIGVKTDTRFPDKYAIPASALPQIDCEQRIPLCRAACCSFKFALSTQDIEEGVVRWTLDQPYMNRSGADGRCVHQDRVSLGCGIYQHRPGLCRMYDCRNDQRIWQDFERRVINPELFNASKHTMLPQTVRRTPESTSAPNSDTPIG